jgi:hypothetical protein
MVTVAAYTYNTSKYVDWGRATKEEIFNQVYEFLYERYVFCMNSNTYFYILTVLYYSFRENARMRLLCFLSAAARFSLNTCAYMYRHDLWANIRLGRMSYYTIVYDNTVGTVTLYYKLQYYINWLVIRWLKIKMIYIKIHVFFKFCHTCLSVDKNVMYIFTIRGLIVHSVGTCACL